MNSILIIDDEEVDFIIHSKIIKLGKHAEKITYQSSAIDALEYLAKLNDNSSSDWPTHIFLDINMPGMNGFEFIEAYKKNVSSPCDTKIYILSSSINPKDQERAQQTDIIEEYLTKPLTIEKAAMLFNKN